MLLDVDKEELVSLIVGINPSWDQMKNPTVGKVGKWWGGFLDRWKWDKDSLMACSEEELLKLYQYLKLPTPSNVYAEQDVDKEAEQEELFNLLRFAEETKNMFMLEAVEGELKRRGWV